MQRSVVFVNAALELDLMKRQMFFMWLRILFFLQMGLYFMALVMAGLNAQWFGPAATEVMFLMREVETEHGLGNQVGLGAEKEGYAKLKERDPKYKAYKRTFGRYHGLSSLCNLMGVICTTTNLIYTALNLSTI